MVGSPEDAGTERIVMGFVVVETFGGDRIFKQQASPPRAVHEELRQAASGMFLVHATHHTK